MLVEITHKTDLGDIIVKGADNEFSVSLKNREIKVFDVGLYPNITLNNGGGLEARLIELEDKVNNNKYIKVLNLNW